MRYALESKSISRSIFGAPLFLLLLSASFAWCQAVGMSPDRGRDFGWSLTRSSRTRKANPTPQQKFIQPLTGEADDVVRVETDLVINDILVFDRQGRPVRGLSKGDFIVSEDTASQEVAVFSNEGRALPRSVILIIDHSFSQMAYIERSIEAAKVLVDKLNANDRMAIVTDDIRLIAPPTSDKESLKADLETLKAATMAGEHGKSQQYSALMAVLSELSDNKGTRPVIIFQTDGDQTASLLAGRTYKGADAVGLEKFSYDDIIETARSKGVTAYSVFSGVSLNGVPMREKLLRAEAAVVRETKLWQEFRGIVPASRENKTSKAFLKTVVNSRLRDELAVGQIATLTGGLSQTLESPEQAGEVYERILSDMNSRYILGYYPTSQSKDDKPREINIEVRGHPEYRIWGRKSYVPL
jgi:VWFA-related protein